jgi:hypothetical protein
MYKNVIDYGRRSMGAQPQFKKLANAGVKSTEPLASKCKKK